MSWLSNHEAPLPGESARIGLYRPSQASYGGGQGHGGYGGGQTFHGGGQGGYGS